MTKATIDLLRDLGFNQLEAEIYLALLRSEPVTAYRLGTLVGKPTANVYKAVESLSRRGAVMIQDGDSRTVSAMPVREFMRQSEREFLQRTRTLGERLSKVEKHHSDERVYRLDSAQQVLERGRDMLEKRAKKIAVVDAFPAALEAVIPSIRKAIHRGVAVYVLAYASVEIEGAEVTVVGFGDQSVRAWGGQQLNIVIDGQEHMLALLSAGMDGVVQAVWSQSLYLSCILHAGILCEQTLHKLNELRDSGELGPAAVAVLDLHGFFIRSDVPGHKALSRSGRRAR